MTARSEGVQAQALGGAPDTRLLSTNASNSTPPGEPLPSSPSRSPSTPRPAPRPSHVREPVAQSLHVAP